MQVPFEWSDASNQGTPSARSKLLMDRASFKRKPDLKGQRSMPDTSCYAILAAFERICRNKRAGSVPHPLRTVLFFIS